MRLSIAQINLALLSAFAIFVKYSILQLMEENNGNSKNIHVGHNITRFRHLRGLKQEALAEMIGITQQTLSHHEQQRNVNPEVLKRIAIALNVPEDVLQNLEDDNTTFIIENNTFGDNDNIGIGVHVEQDKHNIYNPIEKVVELMERLLESEQQKSKALEERLSRLEELIKKEIDQKKKKD